jgi:FAD synthetase
MKEILAAIWKQSVNGETVSRERLEDELKKYGSKTLIESLEGMKKDGLIVEGSKGLELTEEGRKKLRIVACGGVYDILHPGHAFILKEAKSHADILVVIVARDSTVKKRKRIPIVPEDQRREMVGELKPVDVSVLGYEGDTLKIVEEIKPDVIALGPDQHHDEERIKEELAERGIDLEVIRIKEYKECELNSTKAILQRIIERNYPNSRGG